MEMNRLNNQNSNFDTNYVDLQSLLKALIRKKGLILFTSLIFFIIALIAASYIPIKYQSSILLKIQHKPILGTFSDNNQINSLNLSEEPIALQTALIQSEYILKPVIKSLTQDLQISPSFHGKSEYEILTQIRKNLTLSDLNKTNDHGAKATILRVSLTGTDPVILEKLLNQIATTTKEHNQKFKISEAQKTLKFLKQKLPHIKSALEIAENKFNIYRSEKARVNVKSHADHLYQHLSKINQQIDLLNSKEIRLSQNFTVKHPYMIALHKELAKLQYQKNKLQNKLKLLPSSEKKENDLKREVDIENKMYMNLLNQIHQLEVTQSGIYSDIDMLTDASKPYRIESTKTSVIGFFGLFIGFLLGCMGVSLWFLTSQRVNDPHWTENKATS